MKRKDKMKAKLVYCSVPNESTLIRKVMGLLLRGANVKLPPKMVLITVAAVVSLLKL